MNLLLAMGLALLLIAVLWLWRLPSLRFGRWAMPVRHRGWAFVAVVLHRLQRLTVLSPVAWAGPRHRQLNGTERIHHLPGHNAINRGSASAWERAVHAGSLEGIVMQVGAVPPTPAVPASWTPATIGVFAGALLTFFMASLIQFGVVVPAHISAEVQVVVGLLGQIGSLVGALIAGLHHNAQVTKVKLAQLAAGSWPNRTN